MTSIKYPFADQALRSGGTSSEQLLTDQARIVTSCLNQISYLLYQTARYTYLSLTPACPFITPSCQFEVGEHCKLFIRVTCVEEQELK